MRIPLVRNFTIVRSLENKLDIDIHLILIYSTNSNKKTHCMYFFLNLPMVGFQSILSIDQKNIL